MKTYIHVLIGTELVVFSEDSAPVSCYPQLVVESGVAIKLQNVKPAWSIVIPETSLDCTEHPTILLDRNSVYRDVNSIKELLTIASTYPAWEDYDNSQAHTLLAQSTKTIEELTSTLDKTKFELNLYREFLVKLNYQLKLIASTNYSGGPNSRKSVNELLNNILSEISILNK